MLQPHTLHSPPCTTQMLLCICWLVPYALVISTSCLFPATTVAIFSQLRWTCLSTVGRWAALPGLGIGACRKWCFWHSALAVAAHWGFKGHPLWDFGHGCRAPAQMCVE